MEFKMVSQNLGEIFALPAVIADNCLTMASPTALRAILFFYKNAARGSDVSVETIAKAINRDEEEVLDAMYFWQERGIVTVEGGAAKKKLEVKAQAELQKQAAKAEVKPQPIKPALPDIPVSKPSHEEIAARLSEERELQLLFDEAGAKLGKTISYDGQATLIMLHDSYGLSVEIILMLLEYAVTKKKTGFNEIAGLGKYWCENEIFTLERAEEYIEKQTGVEGIWKEVQQKAGLKKANPTTKQRRFLSIWKYEYGFDSEMIFMAYEICVDNTGKMSLEYMDKVLSSWHGKGIKTPLDVEKDRKSFEGKKTVSKSGTKKKESQASYDIDEYLKRTLDLKNEG